jgi:L-ascorbate metabolism protein UlaG (beta-lactamase superfamily)
MKIRWLSHACFEIKNSKTILIDPYFKENPLAPKYEEKPDLILVSHEHFDHSDVSRFVSKIVCPPNMDCKNSIKMKIGDIKEIEGVKIVMVESSHHQSEYATGFIIEWEGKRLYHPGDTYVDAIKNRGNIDVFFVPIGGFYTMNIDEAIQALKIVKPKLAIPMHFNTFEKIKANPEEFKEKAEKLGFNVKVLNISESIEI